MTRHLTVVPTPATKRLGRAMIQAAEQEPGADVAHRFALRIQEGQVAALIGVLLTATKQHKKLGRRPLPITYSEADRLEAKRRYKAGHRDEWTVEGRRQYDRLSRQRQMARSRPVNRAGHPSTSVDDAARPTGVSVARGTMATKETTHKSTPAGAATPHGRGLADVKGNDRLMHIVEPTSDTPPPPCPACGSLAEGSTGVQVDKNLKTCEQFFICRSGHLYSMRWPEVA